MEIKTINYNSVDMDYVYINGSLALKRTDEPSTNEPRPYFIKLVATSGATVTIPRSAAYGWRCLDCSDCEHTDSTTGLSAWWCGEVQDTSLEFWDGLWINASTVQDVIFGDEAADLTHINMGSSVLAVGKLDVSRCTNLQWLNCSNGIWSELDMHGCALLEVLICTGNNLTGLDLRDTRLDQSPAQAHHRQFFRQGPNVHLRDIYLPRTAMSGVLASHVFAWWGQGQSGEYRVHRPQGSTAILSAQGFTFTYREY
ncbi:MAG: hypothetical protein FWC81_04105 [Coriobacteriia bacterium]|nr:hypothetical protein [Coriobacteriia bacterium]